MSSASGPGSWRGGCWVIVARKCHLLIHFSVIRRRTEAGNENGSIGSHREIFGVWSGEVATARHRCGVNAAQSRSPVKQPTHRQCARQSPPADCHRGSRFVQAASGPDSLGIAAPIADPQFAIAGLADGHGMGANVYFITCAGIQLRHAIPGLTTQMLYLGYRECSMPCSVCC